MSDGREIIDLTALSSDDEGTAVATAPAQQQTSQQQTSQQQTSQHGLEPRSHRTDRHKAEKRERRRERKAKKERLRAAQVAREATATGSQTRVDEGSRGQENVDEGSQARVDERNRGQDVDEGSRSQDVDEGKAKGKGKDKGKGIDKGKAKATPQPIDFAQLLRDGKEREQEGKRAERKLKDELKAAAAKTKTTPTAAKGPNKRSSAVPKGPSKPSTAKGPSHPSPPEEVPTGNAAAFPAAAAAAAAAAPVSVGVEPTHAFAYGFEVTFRLRDDQLRPAPDAHEKEEVQGGGGGEPGAFKGSQQPPKKRPGGSKQPIKTRAEAVEALRALGKNPTWRVVYDGEAKGTKDVLEGGEDRVSVKYKNEAVEVVRVVPRVARREDCNKTEVQQLFKKRPQDVEYIVLRCTGVVDRRGTEDEETGGGGGGGGGGMVDKASLAVARAERRAEDGDDDDDEAREERALDMLRRQLADERVYSLDEVEAKFRECRLPGIAPAAAAQSASGQRVRAAKVLTLHEVEETLRDHPPKEAMLVLEQTVRQRWRAEAGSTQVQVQVQVQHTAPAAAAEPVPRPLPNPSLTVLHRTHVPAVANQVAREVFRREALVLDASGRATWTPRDWSDADSAANAFCADTGYYAAELWDRDGGMLEHKGFDYLRVWVERLPQNTGPFDA